jgi:hypothetical protein
MTPRFSSQFCVLGFGSKADSTVIQQLDRRLVAAGDGGAGAVLQAIYRDLDAVVAAEWQHDALFRLRIPISRADVAAVADQRHLPAELLIHPALERPSPGRPIPCITVR